MIPTGKIMKLVTNFSTIPIPVEFEFIAKGKNEVNVPS